MIEKLNWPLMENNITKEDLKVLIEFLKSSPRLTQSTNVLSFEEEWSKWLGVKYSVFVNSGASANLITINSIKELYWHDGEIIVPTLTWVSDIAAVIQNGFTPVFVDINPKTLCMDLDQIILKTSNKTRAVFITHTQGFNGLNEGLLSFLKDKNIALIEDVCEAHGATFKKQKLGSYGLISNFSFYFAHHMSTIEGGMICTNDEKIYETARMMRSHGLVREIKNSEIKKRYIQENSSLNPEFIFSFPGYNMRNTEIGAVLGRNQLKHLDENNQRRINNFQCFLNNLDSSKYQTDFDMNGSCNYAFNLILKKADPIFRDKVESTLKEANVEYRRGSAGGGNQMRQPYLKKIVKEKEWECYPHIEHVHFYGYYIGNYPDLKENKILALCNLLNGVSS
jgi:CDP-4-dehydro-6-deoxyglucose reductase, E1